MILSEFGFMGLIDFLDLSSIDNPKNPLIWRIQIQTISVHYRTELYQKRTVLKL